MSVSSSHSYFRIKPIYVREGNTPLGKWTLRRFQEEILDLITSKKDVLLTAPTGSGKTLSLLLGEWGAVGLYPNNKLLLDQQRSIDKILRNAFNAKLIALVEEQDADVLRLYEIDCPLRDGPPIVGRKRVAVVLLSGRYIGYERDKDGRLVPKRRVVLENIVKRICYTRPGDEPYIVTLATPDTALLIMAGMYRDFEQVGYTVHNTILSAIEGEKIDYILSRSQVATAKGSLAEIGQIRQCLLKYPWFIDEFHLYGAYEASGLLPILRVFRDRSGWDEPVILSSATPKGTLYERLMDMLKPRTVDAEIVEKGDPEALVRGETEVEVVNLDVRGRGISRWFKVGDHLPVIVLNKLDEISNTVRMGGNVFIVTDRINQVPPIVEVLVEEGFSVECGVSIPPAGCSSKVERLLVGSESVSQGIDRENVKYGIITGVNWATLIQRFGRIGRKTNSKVVIVTPSRKDNNPLAKIDGQTISYKEFVENVKNDFPPIDFDLPKEPRIKEILDVRETLLDYTATIAFSQVSKPRGTFRSLSQVIRKTRNILDYFYGPPDSIASIMMFRSTGFEVVVEGPNIPERTTDIASVLRNYIVRTVQPIIYKTPDGLTKQMIKLTIDYTPGRQILMLRPSPTTKEDIADYLAGTITTLRELSKLGFSLYIKSPEDAGDTGLNVPIIGSVKDQVVALVKTSEEVATYLTYTVRAIQVHRGERKTLVALLL